jgi:hypothetical protein
MECTRTDAARPEISCPECRHPHGRYLPFVSEMAMVDYYRCWDCGFVWTIPKASAGSAIRVELKPDRRRYPRTRAG